MSAAVYNFTIEQGATLRLAVQWKDSVGNAIPMTSYTGRLQIRADYTSGTTIADLTTSNGGLILDAPNGKITVFMSATATQALTFTTAVYDLIVTAPSAGDTTRLLKGTVTLDPGVTH